MKESLDGEILEISAYYDRIIPCMDCRKCWETGICPIDDKMQLIYGDDFDNVVIASPVYMSGLTGPLVSLASRFQTYYVSEYFLKQRKELKSKSGALILVGGGDGSPRNAIGTAKWMMRNMNASLSDEDMIFSLNTNTVPAIEDSDAVFKVKSLTKRMNGQN